MSAITQPLRDEHQELFPHIHQLKTAADTVGTAEPAVVTQAIEEAYEFLSGHLIPHAQAEDAALYPVVAEVMGSPHAPDTMRRDHVEVDRLVGELAGLRQQVAGGQITADTERELRRVLYGLYTLVGVHFAKEEEVYLPMLDEALTPESARKMFEAMEAAAHHAKQAARR